MPAAKTRINTMTNRMLIGLILIAVTVLGDLGLFTVFLDSAFRGHYPNIQTFTFLMVFLFPIFMIVLFIKGLIKTNAWLAIAVTSLAFLYMIVQYDIRLLTELDLLTFVVGFLTVILLSITVLKKHRNAIA